MNTRNKILLSMLVLVAAYSSTRLVVASDHDDGETDIKARSLNLTDHYAFKDGSDLVLVMYVNGRALPGYQYHFSTQALYDFHVARVTAKTDAAKNAADVKLRFQFAAPATDGTQAITFSVLNSAGASLGSDAAGKTTTLANGKAGTNTTNTATIDGKSYSIFAGMREDTFHFDVIRFFQVRSALAGRFFGGSDGNGNTASLPPPNCKGQTFAQEILGGAADNDGDKVNLFNPPSCAPDFTKNYNVSAIVAKVPLTALQASGETVFDTWSTISIPK